MYANIERKYIIPMFFPDEPFSPILSLSLQHYGNVWLVSLEHHQDIGQNTQILHGVWNTVHQNAFVFENDKWVSAGYTKTGHTILVSDYVLGIIEQQIKDIIDHEFDLPYIINLERTRVYKKVFRKSPDGYVNIYGTICIIVLDHLNTALIQIAGHCDFACVYVNGMLVSTKLPKHPHLREEIERIIDGNYDLMNRDVISRLGYR